MSDFIDTIGDMIETLEGLDAKTAQVFVDGKHPTGLSSWRGIYRDLAIECEGKGYEETCTPERGKPFNIDLPGYGTYSPGVDRVQIKANPSVEELLKAFKLADGEEFEGYKGGQFAMSLATDLWVSEYGDASKRRILKAFFVSVDTVEFKTLELPC